MAENPEGNKSRSQAIIDFVGKAWSFFLGIIGALTAINEFIKLVQGDQSLATWMIAIAGLLTLLAILVYVGWLNSDLLHRPWVRSSARALMVLILLGGAFAVLRIQQRNQERNAKFTILVLDFKGPQPENYPVREDIIRQLNDVLRPYQDETVIIGDNTYVSEDEGSNKALEVGKKYRADLVLWGKYQIQDENARVTVHVENLTELSRWTLPTSDNYIDEAPVDHFQFEDRLSKQSGAIALFISGMTRYEVKDYAEAEKRIGEAITIGEWPDQLESKAMLYFYRGYARLQIKDFERSIEDYTEVIRLLGTSPLEHKSQIAKAHNNRGEDYRGLGNDEMAEKDFKEALAIDPKYLNPYFNLGALYIDSKEYELAISQMTTVLSIDANNAAAHNNIGYIYKQQGEYSKAIPEFDNAIELNPEYAKSYNNRGNLYIDQEQLDLAIQDLTKATTLDPSYEKAFRNLGRAYAKQADYQSALSNFSKAIDLAPDDPWAYYYRGLTYAYLDQTDLAIADYRTAQTYTQDAELQQKINTELTKLGVGP
jgi:tetratricopeptide (TPR) repeat protein